MFLNMEFKDLTDAHNIFKNWEKISTSFFVRNCLMRHKMRFPIDLCTNFYPKTAKNRVFNFVLIRKRVR